MGVLFLFRAVMYFPVLLDCLVRVFIINMDYLNVGLPIAARYIVVFLISLIPAVIGLLVAVEAKTRFLMAQLITITFPVWAVIVMVVLKGQNVLWVDMFWKWLPFK